MSYNGIDEKGNSKYTIKALIKQEDVKEFGVSSELAGTYQELTPVEWAETTGKPAKSIRAAMAREKRQLDEGMQPKDLRMIVGLEPNVCRPRAVKKKSEKIGDVLNRYTVPWLYRAGINI